MTTPKPLPEIAPCECGKPGAMFGLMTPHIKCTRQHEPGLYACWIGPDRKTPRAAIKAWNKMMEKKP